MSFSSWSMRLASCMPTACMSFSLRSRYAMRSMWSSVSAFFISASTPATVSPMLTLRVRLSATSVPLSERTLTVSLRDFRKASARRPKKFFLVFTTSYTVSRLSLTPVPSGWMMSESLPVCRSCSLLSRCEPPFPRDIMPIMTRVFSRLRSSSLTSSSVFTPSSESPASVLRESAMCCVSVTERSNSCQLPSMPKYTALSLLFISRKL